MDLRDLMYRESQSGTKIVTNPYAVIERSIIEASSLSDSLRLLEGLLSGGFAVWTDGSLYEIRQLVEMVNGLRIKIFPDEHPPPHFHLRGGGMDAAFSILDCALLKGKIGGRERRLVEYWHKRSRPLLVTTWNSTRPSSCPVGPIQE